MSTTATTTTTTRKVARTILTIDIDAHELTTLQRALRMMADGETNCSPVQMVVANTLHQRIGEAALQAVKREQTVIEVGSN